MKLGWAYSFALHAALVIATLVIVRERSFALPEEPPDFLCTRSEPRILIRPADRIGNEFRRIPVKQDDPLLLLRGVALPEDVDIRAAYFRQHCGCGCGGYVAPAPRPRMTIDELVRESQTMVIGRLRPSSARLRVWSEDSESGRITRAFSTRLLTR